MIDIHAYGGQGFDATEVHFEAASERGKAAMAKIGGFGCIGMTVRKSYVGFMLDRLQAVGCQIKWEGQADG
jgi:hypothetical protein